MKGFKHTGRGPKMGHSFSRKAGFTHSGTNKQNVRGYTRDAPKCNFAAGGMVISPMASNDSSVIKRKMPVTGFDAEHGGKSPLRPGFNKGGRACYAEGGKVETLGAAIRMIKQLMARGNSASDATAKAARRYNVKPSQLLVPSNPIGGGGLPAEKQMLARGGISKMVNRAAAAAAAGYNQGRTAAAQQQVGITPKNQNITTSSVKHARNPASMGFPAPVTDRAVKNHRYGSFRRGPLVG